MSNILREYIRAQLLIEKNVASGKLDSDLMGEIGEFMETRHYDDVLDSVFKRIAPNLVRHVMEQEINEDVAEFRDGAIEGRFERRSGKFSYEDPSPKDVGHPADSADYVLGYTWGWHNSDTWEGNDLPTEARKEAVESQIKEFEDQISEQMVIAALETANEKVNPVKLFKKAVAAIRTAVQEEGWVGGLRKGLPIAIGIIVGEALDNFIIPMAFFSLTGIPIPPLPVGVGEIINPVVISMVGAETETEELADELGWYESEYGETPSLPPRETNELRLYIREILKEQNVLATGMCFPFAAKKAEEWFEDHFTKGGPGRRPKKHPDLNNMDKFKVVHGKVTDKWKKPPKPIVHAWVEMGDLVFDDQTKITKPDGVPKDVYYDMYQPEVVEEYTAEDAVVNCAMKGEGPWNKDLHDILKQRDAWMNDA